MIWNGQPAQVLRELLGDSYEKLQLLTAKELGALPGISPKRVYELPIPQVRVGKRAVRWRVSDVRDFLMRRKAA